MRVSLLLLAVGLAACSSSREASEPGYRITEEPDGSVTISVDPDDPGAMVAALTAAAGRLPWTPPERAGPLVQTAESDLGRAGTGYRYTFGDGRFDVYVYDDPGDVDAQLAETEAALADLVRRGPTEGRAHVESFALVDRSQAPISFRGADAVLHRIVFEETVDGETWDSYMYLVQDRAGWVKVRASHRRGARSKDDVNALVRALLAG